MKRKSASTQNKRRWRFADILNLLEKGLDAIIKIITLLKMLLPFVELAGVLKLAGLLIQIGLMAMFFIWRCLPDGWSGWAGQVY
jgi:hypothetical protein